MNSRLDWLVLSDYYSIYVTNAPPKRARAKIARALSGSSASAVRTLSAVAKQNVRGTMISPTPMRTATDIRRNECAVESRKRIRTAIAIRILELAIRVELMTSSLPMTCSTN